MIVADLKLSFSLFLLFTESCKFVFSPFAQLCDNVSVLCPAVLQICFPSERRSCLQVIEEGGGRGSTLSVVKRLCG